MCCYNQVVVVTRTFSTETIESVCCCKEVDVVNSYFLSKPSLTIYIYIYICVMVRGQKLGAGAKVGWIKEYRGLTSMM